MKKNKVWEWLGKKKIWLSIIGILTLPLIMAILFAWTAGWINFGRLTSKQMFNQFDHAITPFPPGFRRAHGKGICFTGIFHPEIKASKLSKARVFSQKTVAVIGRFAIAAGDPHISDKTAKLTSMALLLKTDDNQEWRMAMNSVPFFHVATPAGFYDNMVANRPDPKTGKPDPEKIALFYKKHPETIKFDKWAAQAPWPDSYSDMEFNGINAFRFISDDGKSSYVRWCMKPHILRHQLSEKQRSAKDSDFLSEDLLKRLKSGPLYWDMIVTIANPNDPINDPSQPWPANRKQVKIGTLEITGASDQATGPCRDINYDPTILPTGIEVSDDPVLAARSGVYSHSYNARMHEIATGKAPEAVGKKSKK
ncbi:catalase family peroxidase [Chryseobacterium sp.]|uniref:catalase family peroxidase n=1 Tax=Chryseobacterium sp. TaxID=1871047 RepID=UPI0025BF2D18|nr:catalase family peroxidase [Chryseobacterium sp.]MBV8325187.1 catalase family peroxidase [Chryseobacterium sp.]